MENNWTVREIDGDYAILVDDSGVENRVALALLPPEVMDGMRLHFENLQYTVLN